jgi:Ca2+-binding EF-hand superfamily protein
MPDMAQRVLHSEFVWLNTNMTDIDHKVDIDTSPHDVVEVTHGSITKKVGLIGLLTEDPSVYNPGAFGGAHIEPIIDCTEAYLEDVLTPLQLDLMVPLTHQRFPQDREFCDKFGGHLFPIVIGGHDHEPYDEVTNGCRIIKTGMNAENTAIIDVKWKIHADGSCDATKPEIKVDMIPTRTFPPDANVMKRVRGHERVIHELQSAKLFRFDQWIHDEGAVFSTFGNRLAPTNGSMLLCSIIRMGMRAHCCLVNSGSIRAQKVYDQDHQEWFRWSDLKAEIPFPTGMSAFPIPGRVIEATINHSRRLAREDPPVATGAYLQHCDQIEFDEATQKIVALKGKPFDPDELYLTALPGKFFRGMDNHAPLLEWAKENNILLDEENGRNAKELIVELFSALLWLEMGSFETIDKDGDGVLTREEVRQRSVEVFGEEVADLVVDNVFSVADLNHKGCITPVDMMVVQFVASDMLNHVVSHEELGVMQKVASEVLGKRPSHIEVKNVVQNLKDVLDIDRDGNIDREEAMKAIGEVRRRSVLA